MLLWRSWLFIYIVWLAIARVSRAETIECIGQQCGHTLVHCSPNEDCFVSCRDTDSCKGSIINCPLHGDCYIECLGEHSCQDAVIDASASDGNLDLICGSMHDGHDGDENCHSVIVYGSTTTTTTASSAILTDSVVTRSFNVLCSDHDRSCMAATFHCSVHSQCSIACNGYESCSYADVIGTALDRIQVYCSDDRSCFHSQIQAASASQLRIQGCTEPESCQHLSIFCPPRTADGGKHCSLQAGGDSMDSDDEPLSPQELLIYALNGWNDIEIEDNATIGGQMHCGQRYAETCTITNIFSDSDSSWACQDEHDDDHSMCVANISSNGTLQMAMPTTTTNKVASTLSWDLQLQQTGGGVLRNESLFVQPEDTDARGGELMIVGGVMLALLTCIIVGWAKYVKQCRKKHQRRKKAQRRKKRRKKSNKNDMQTVSSVESSRDEPTEIRLNDFNHKSKRKKKGVSPVDEDDEVLQKAMGNKLSIVIENEEKKALPVHRYARV